ncbi:hypothetical protein PO124_16985 [Bacillus licheniformis]|nr:hypothetical protein [Bacillus licheniformis]
MKGGHDIVVEADVMFEDADFKSGYADSSGRKCRQQKMLEHQALHKTLTEAADAGNMSPLSAPQR